MKPPVLTWLKPAGWAVAAVAAVIVFVLLVQALGFRWDPFDRASRRIEAAEVRAATAEADAAARRLESEGAAAQQRRLEAHQQQALDLGRATIRAREEARNAHDAEQILDPARAARIADHDRELCLIAPVICAAAAAEPAIGRDHAVPPGPVAGATDPG